MNILVSISFLIIGIISFISFVKNTSFFNIKKIVCVFVLVFFYLAPYSQFTQNVVFWGMRTYSNNEYLFANFLIIIFLISILIFPIKNKKIDSKINKLSLGVATIHTLLIAQVISLLTVILLENRSLNSTFLNWLLKTFRFNACLISSIFITIYKNKSNSIIKLKHLITSLVLFVLIYNPFSGQMNRYFLFGGYLIILFSVMYNFKHNSFLLLCFLIGFGTIFPMFNIFKSGGSLIDINIFNFDFFNFNFQDYDAYQMLMSTISYVKHNGIVYGWNLLSSMLALIPRNIFESKLQDSGRIIAIYMNASFENLSCPLIAEFYFAFGTFGVIALSLLFSFIINYFDINMYTSIQNYMLSLTICGIIILILRGSLLSSLSFLYAQILSNLIIFSILKFNKGIVKQNDRITI